MARPNRDVVPESELYYENHNLDDVYDRWEAAVSPDRVEALAPVVDDWFRESLKDRNLNHQKHIQTLCRLHNVVPFPKKSELLFVARRSTAVRDVAAESYLVTKKSKSTSGVVVVTVFTTGTPPDEFKKTKTFSCKHDCAYCPNEPEQPRSYLRDEPGVLRANQNGFDAAMQMTDRLRALELNGHPLDKLEILVLGGTWSEYPVAYRTDFVRDVFYAANTIRVRHKRQRKTLLEEQLENERADECRIIGVTLETRPDVVSVEEIIDLRRYGCTRVQLGIQHTHDDVLRKVRRGCTTRDSVRAIRLLKNSGFKIDAHLMPNLPGSCPKKDAEMLTEMLENSKLFVDQLKVYPCEIVPWTAIHKWFKSGEYVPYSDNLLADVVANFKERVPPWVRLNRVLRDIPSLYKVGHSVLPTDWRARVQRRMRKPCACIRCREIGGNAPSSSLPARLVVRTYEASGGLEVFLSYETRNWLFGFARLRLVAPNVETAFPTVFTNGAAMLRELHVYGQATSVRNAGRDLNSSRAVQDKGFGSRLVRAAIRVAVCEGYSRLVVISGVGVKSYYREKFNFRDCERGGYLTKKVVGFDDSRRSTTAVAGDATFEPLWKFYSSGFV